MSETPSNPETGGYKLSNVLRILKRYIESEEIFAMESTCEELYQLISRDVPADKQRSTSQSIQLQDSVAEDASSQDETSQIQANKGCPTKSDHILSEAILCISLDIPYNDQAQTKLLNLTRELSKCDILHKRHARSIMVSSNSVGGPRTCRDYDYFRFVAMPYLHQESYRYVNGYTSGPEGTRVLNATAFQARLASAGCLDTIRSMIWDMMGLEWDSSTHTSTFIQTVSAWVIYGGYFFFHNMVIDPMSVNEDNQRMFKAVRLYRGPIFGLERWNFWQEQLLRSSQDPSVTAEARDLGLRAADLMAALARNIR
ncbi:hypothetical protein ASPVEDRAFT_155904 [Aspergillus versicolor CBS 583.65]|uniref:Uncharacterized protein n=1 Tax=Aspergillus versicolor CBS 583.65 TaxID=1036611 RepID=A0A1L9Q368_ASPVE|nr:uncharacterized protein ASPVEDRAFT_155904 [Aspergillus versicolor CBS 583.65]OJJ08198.1 hypothetical protein ASPVEDRAFT_155904 [Aspergillus versicolor CBS 583.65]